MEAITANKDTSSEFLFIDDLDGIVNDASLQNPLEEKPSNNNMDIKPEGNSPVKAILTNGCAGNNSTQHRQTPCVSISGDFEYIDDPKSSPLSWEDGPVFLQDDIPSQTDLGSHPKSTTGGSTPSSSVIFRIPSIYLPTNLRYIDDERASGPKGKGLLRDTETHSSLKMPGRHSTTKRRVCRHHSDSETKPAAGGSSLKPRHHRCRPRKVRRSISAIETQKEGYRPRVRRSISERSGMIVAGKHLLPPRCRSRPHSHCENGSSRCSSTRTLSTNVSISEIVAVEMGLKEIPGLTAKEARRRRMVCTVAVVAITILVICVLLLAVTLLLSPEVDALLRKENEEIYRSMAAGASTSSPTTEGAAVVANNSAPPSGNPG